MLEFLKFLWMIILNQRGEEPETAEAIAARETKEKDEAEAKEKEEAEAKEKEEAEEAAKIAKEKEEGKPENKFEGYFDHDPSVDEVFAKLKEVDSDHQVLTGKTTKTEQNLAAVKKTLSEAGINVFFDEDGNVKLGAEGKKEVEGKTADKARRFTDDHRAKFNGYFEGDDGGKGFLDTLTFAIQDIVDDMIVDARTNSAKEAKEHSDYMKSRVESAQKLVKLFPVLVAKDKEGKDNPDYNAKFHDRALEIYETEYCRKKEDGTLIEIHPNGQLWGALQASSELGITPTSLSEAKAAGVQIGKDNKKILGKVGGTGAEAQGAKKTKEEYLALNDDERTDYDKKQLGID